MNTIVIFDDDIKLEKLNLDYAGSKVELFALTSNSSICAKIAQVFNEANQGNAYYHNTAKLIEEETDNLRKGICKWSANLGDCFFKGKKIKEWFLMPHLNISSWWFSLLSEKNTLKTSAFLQIAQVNAIKRILGSKKYDLCIISVSNSSLSLSIKNVCRKFETKSKVLPSKRKINFIKYVFIKIELISNFAGAVSKWLNLVYYKCLCRLYLGNKCKRFIKNNSILFTSYFPNVEKDASLKGIFRNKYASALQDKLKEMNIEVTWLLMYLPLENYSFKDAVGIMKKFVNKGENLFMLEEFFSFGNAIRSLWLWLRQFFLSYYLLYSIDKTSLELEPVGKESLPIVRSLWNKSFSGSIGMEGILYYFLFSQVFKKVPNLSDCIYYCEMHAWEKALNAARQFNNEKIRTIGFQHASFSRNYFHYFYDQSELARSGKSSDLPLPDILACNGKHSCSIFTNTGYPKITEVESIRNLYLNQASSSAANTLNKPPFLLVVGSINYNETKALIVLVNNAFSDNKIIEIKFKGHPAVPLESLFKELNIDYKARGFSISNQAISESLKNDCIVLSATSTVSIEALAFGREVIIPIFCDSMVLNPLIDFNGLYHKVVSPEELKDKVKQISEGYVLHSAKDYRQFVSGYWYVDRELPRWKELLKICP